jgi:beta-phosphoglucomutase family hydrolase
MTPTRHSGASGPRASARLGAIFDWDGVVVDSSSCHREAWERLGREIGRALPPDHFERAFGLKNERIIPEIMGWTEDPEEVERLSLRKEELYREAVRRDGLAPLPGVPDFLARLAAAGIPAAVGTSTHRLNVEACIDAVGLRDAFAAVVTAEDVSEGKPDPQVFLLGAERLGLPPEHCIVFEDAIVGIEAARRGGMKAVAVTTTHPATSLGAADIVVERLDEVSVEELRRLFLSD